MSAIHDEYMSPSGWGVSLEYVWLFATHKFWPLIFVLCGFVVMFTGAMRCMRAVGRYRTKVQLDEQIKSYCLSRKKSS